MYKQSGPMCRRSGNGTTGRTRWVANLTFITAFEADHLSRVTRFGFPIWARRHRPATPDRC